MEVSMVANVANNNEEATKQPQMFAPDEVLANKYESLLRRIIERESFLEDEYNYLCKEYQAVKEMNISAVIIDKGKTEESEKITSHQSSKVALPGKSENKETEDKFKALEIKYKSLIDKLSERIECPVCLEVPESGPISSCSNGHLVCSKCKGDSCPTCRIRMGEAKSLLAVTVLENIEHKCRNPGCEQFLPLSELEEHRKVCSFRLVTCPAYVCNEKVPYCGIIDHCLNKCKHSKAKQTGKICDISEYSFIHTFHILKKRAYKMVTLMMNGKYFFLNIIRGQGEHNEWSFYVEMLGSEEECSDFEVEIVVHSDKDSSAEGQQSYRFIGEPVYMEEEKKTKKKCGLIVGNKMMETKISRKKSKDESMRCFNVTLDIFNE